MHARTACVKIVEISLSQNFPPKIGVLQYEYLGDAEKRWRPRGVSVGGTSKARVRFVCFQTNLVVKQCDCRRNHLQYCATAGWLLTQLTQLQLTAL